MVVLWVFSALAAFGLVCVAISGVVRSRRKRRQAQRLQNARDRLLIHSINDERCTGCNACVAVCPTNVLQLQSNKTYVARFSDCIQCEQCVTACPTTALVMHYQGTPAPPIRMPELDEYYQAVPGLYLIGGVSGKPLVKNAANLGRAVVEHMFVSGMKPAPAAEGRVDVLVIGSGPGGLAAALTCSARGFSCVVLEKDELVAATVARWPTGKECMAEPYDVKSVSLLPVFDSTKEELLAAWGAILDEHGIRVSTRESAENVARDEQGWFTVKTEQRVLTAQRVVMAIGTRSKPRKLGAPGEHLLKVTSFLSDPAHHHGQRLLVVGGGDSAVEAAIALGETAQSVVLSYRGRQLSRCKAQNRQRLDDAVKAGKVVVRFGSTVREIKPDEVILGVGGRQERIPNDHVIVSIGGEAPIKWIESIGVRFVEQPHMFQRSATDKLVEQLLGPVAETPQPRSARLGTAPLRLRVSAT
jgi:thioredoxin reductase/ferredoxin